ncbi:helix-hairpin-helix domain-containing protein [Aquitalea sp. LB_tupeE]|uniref:helix-hairpin-helix domain-containing protein n=1 Tax=Aquitalea sp. LB_tupeE TaxID=2748078 RepID=UPI0015B8951C|nr:helix-hairpin-helix domain-containing protein [Aquitalea sp. LB_tupeE]NWK79096.1 helix-hairpin-helix domain-containing protein [Aquitalea sp. LB_tupeE]
MNPLRCPPASLARTLLQLPNVGPAMAADLRLLGHTSPHSLTAADPYRLYAQLCQQTGVHHDPCVLDVFIAVCHYLQHDEALPWWHFTAARKQKLPGDAAAGIPLYNKAP